MASLIWTSVWWFLMVELVITVILVIPVPRKIRNRLARLIMKLNLSERMGKLGIFVTLALAAALFESMSSVHYIEERQKLEHQLMQGGPASIEHERIFHDLDQQRKFRSERNMYLSGFSLTLLLVIVRICQLMQESVEYEAEIDRMVTIQQPTAPSSSGIEMTKIKSKQEKKKD